jgi:hypothetical protein
MPIVIKDLRITFIFTETMPGLSEQVQQSAPLAAFVSKPGYVQIVDRLRQGDSAPLDLCMPWLHPHGQNFWRDYLDTPPQDAKASLCHDNLVPLRLPRLFGVTTHGFPPGSRVLLESLYFPFGTGLMISTLLRGQFDIASAGAHALSARYDKAYRIGTSEQPMTLEQLATAALDDLRLKGFGRGVTGRRSKLFSVASIVRGDGADPKLPQSTGGKVHCLLNGLSNWTRAWADLAPQPLKDRETKLDTKTTTAWAGDLLFAGKRGRAVWFPWTFSSGAGQIHSLGCYHRNLSFASLQTEALLILAAEVAAEMALPTPTPNKVQWLGRRAAGLLGRLHSGVKCYRTDSVRAQIEQSDLLTDVNALRQHFNMPSIP